jgi:hypothetical protein
VPSSTPAAAVVTPSPSASPSPTASPTKAAPTKKPNKKGNKPKKTKKPKPSPTPEVWSAAYRNRVCAAVRHLEDTATHRDTAAALIAANDFPHARAEAYEIVALSVQAKDETEAAPKWPPGDDLLVQLTGSAHRLGQGATQVIEGMANVDAGVISAGQAEMTIGVNLLEQAKAKIAELALTYGPASC